MSYYLDGITSGGIINIDYTYNNDNLLTGFSTDGGSGLSFMLYDTTVDGLGRLVFACEQLTKPGNQFIFGSCQSYGYDGLSQLTSVGSAEQYVYQDNGDMTSSNQTTFSYTGNEMTTAGADSLDYDENGNLISGPKDASTSVSVVYNWENKLRNATIDVDGIAIKYDPAGNRIFKSSTIHGDKKYIVDVVGDLPTILLELEPTTSARYAITNSYLYANSQILSEYNGSGQFYYLHDRLGSVRQIINNAGTVC
ncbi:MAG: hypothetical protein K8R02_04930 [Anaerohalosphaeraceae bacterium]|nr:hypothetical protein [Anaerohalosphaeraceae bacterium]